jgi:hypothetical protein
VIEQADFLVKNSFKTAAVQVSRRPADGSTDFSVGIDPGNTERVPVQGTDVSLVIEAPVGFDIKDCFLRSRAEVDLAVLVSRTGSHWKINIVPNDLEPEAPTTVNVNVGEDE